MTYQGGKYYQSKYIVPILMKCCEDNHIVDYYEPFLGGANIMYKMPESLNRYGNDIDLELIAYYTHVCSGGESYEEVDRELFNDMRDNPDKYEPYQLGNAKYMASFGSKGFKAGWATKDRRSNKSHYQAALSTFKKQIPKIKTVNFSNYDYRDLIIKDNSLVYCDPPYAGTTQYEGREFNHNKFWDWVRKNSENYFIVVSEFSAPDDFIEIAAFPKKVSLAANCNTMEKVDKLFIYSKGKYADYYNKGE